MSEDTDTTLWSLPDEMEAPRDELKLQLEVYQETILLRGFEKGGGWVRPVSADGIANALTRHLGFSSGLLPEGAVWWNQGGGRTDGGPVAAAEGVAGGPATGGVQGSRPAPAPHARHGLRLLAGPSSLGLRRGEQAH